MRRGALGIVAAAVAVTAVAWLQSLPSLTAGEAVDVATGALAAAGVDSAVIDAAPKADVYRADPDDSGEPAWRVAAALDDGTVDLWISRASGEPVFVDDASDDGTRYLLTDDQVAELDRYRATPARDRRLRRNLLVTVAAAVAAGTAAALASAAPGVVVRRSQPGAAGLDH